MAVVVWSYGKLRILALTDNPALGGGHLPHPGPTHGRGELDGLRMALEAVLSRGCRAILLDMQWVTYLDSADVGELFACRKRLQHQGGDIEMADLNRVFRIFDDEAEALAALGG
jgi:hypothetical protein